MTPAVTTTMTRRNLLLSPSPWPLGQYARLQYAGVNFIVTMVTTVGFGDVMVPNEGPWIPSILLLSLMANFVSSTHRVLKVSAIRRLYEMREETKKSIARKHNVRQAEQEKKDGAPGTRCPMAQNAH